MTNQDKEIISGIPARYKPVGAWTYFGLSILFSIPVIGFIFLIIKALDNGGNINVQNYARSFFCVYVIAIIVVVITLVSGGVTALTAMLS